MLALIAAVGLVVGITLGALGAGGSVLAVPALVYLAGQGAVEATTGSLVVVGTTALIGVIPHARAHRVRLGQGAAFGALGVGGAFVGSRLSAGVAPAVLLSAFAALMLVVAALMLRRRRARSGVTGADDAAAPAPFGVRPLRCECRAVLLLVATATGVGILTGFFGVGGGFAVVPALVLALRMPMRVAVGTSLVAIAVNTASALVFRLGQDVQLDWPVIGVLTGAAVVGGLVGARAMSRVRPARLELALIVLLVVVAVYTGARSVPGL